jgi:hypothetical protein
VAGPSRPPQRTSTGSSIESVPLGSISSLDNLVEVDEDEEWRSSGSWERDEAVVSEEEDDGEALEERKRDAKKEKLVLHALVEDDGSDVFRSAHEWQV